MVTHRADIIEEQYRCDRLVVFVVHVFVRACMRACVRACSCLCVRARECVYVFVLESLFCSHGG